MESNLGRTKISAGPQYDVRDTQHMSWICDSRAGREWAEKQEIELNTKDTLSWWAHSCLPTNQRIPTTLRQSNGPFSCPDGNHNKSKTSCCSHFLLTLGTMVCPYLASNVDLECYKQFGWGKTMSILIIIIKQTQYNHIRLIMWAHLNYLLAWCRKIGLAEADWYRLGGARFT